MQQDILRTMSLLRKHETKGVVVKMLESMYFSIEYKRLN